MTTRDIATIYSHLETLMDSPRSSAKKLTCACHHMFISKDSKYCALCDQVVDILSELLNERSQQEQDFIDCQGSLITEKEQHKSLQQDLVRLQKTYQETSLALESKTQTCTVLEQSVQKTSQGYKQILQENIQLRKEKESVEHELKELSDRLFEEAHAMVANEKREKQQLMSEKTKLEHWMDCWQMETPEVRKLKWQEEIDLPKTVQESIDPLMHEFRDFVRSAGLSPMQDIQTLPFMQHTLKEDIEPTLPPRMTEEICEAMLMNTCFIEQDNLSAKDKCRACGRETDLTYRLKTSTEDDWMRIDRRCRDRLVSICDFFVFIRNIHQGNYHRSGIRELFETSSQLKLQMFCARTLSLHNIPSKALCLGDDVSARKNRFNESTVHPENSVWMDL